MTIISKRIEKRIQKKMEKLEKKRKENTSHIKTNESLNNMHKEFYEIYCSKRDEYMKLNEQLHQFTLFKVSTFN